MKLKNIDHVNITVANFDETVAWYGRVFGFELVEEAMQDDTRWGVIRQGDVMLCIYEYPDCALEDRFAMRKRGLHGINHYGVRITDGAEWEAIVEREKLNVLYGGPIRWNHNTSWYVADPTGWEIEVALWDDDTIRFG
ncbi:MAG: catechol 2,3-dioxygenase-like lactoylglutathione lyase family enzyme [Candidatus Krumholzibacteriia bacterium]|jgi:catechol 2,3-dioxygenase-like lactoylglutathione lyase family enzyme